MDILIIAAVIIVYGMRKHYIRKNEDNMRTYPERRYGFSDTLNQANWLR